MWFEGLLLLVHHLGVNDRAFVLLALLLVGLGFAAARGLGFAGAGFFGSGFVKLGGNSLPRFVELFARRLDCARVAAFQRFLHVCDGIFDLALVVAGNFVSIVL